MAAHGESAWLACYGFLLVVTALYLRQVARSARAAR